MELATYANYQQYKQELDTELRKTTEGFVKIGYLLKVAKDTDVLRESGYANVYEFAQAEYNIDKSQVSRFMSINDRFSEGGYSDRLKEQFRGFGHAKLTIMLQLPDEINEELTPQFSKTEIQALKEEYDEESKITALEVLMEGEDPEQKTMDSNLYKILHQLGKDEPKLYVKLHGATRGNVSDIYEILAPDWEKIYSIRISGVGRFLFSVKDKDKPVTITSMRTGEKEEYVWEEVLGCIEHLTAAGPDAEAAWEAVYGEEFPEKKKIAPVQPTAQPKKEPPKKETKVQKAKKPEPKKAVPARPEPKTEAEEPLPGQDSIMNHPEYQPENPKSLNAEPISDDSEEEVIENVTKDSEIVEKTPLEEAEKPVNPKSEADFEEPAAGLEENIRMIAGYKAGMTNTINRLQVLVQEERWGSMITAAEDIKWRAEQIIKILARG
ncbi:MAG: hypothetical protein IJC59_04880 [Lachnospiraceae bacterium]|nr:hypothetical protein [Lachnospiraceae bacterium]